jgi:CRP-like cAMP-binding protein
MLLTIEKVLLVKSAGIFAEIPDECLVEVASALQELAVEPGTEIIKKGELGTSLYIVVEGRVRVHDGDKVLAELGPPEVFGELSALDPEPRMASVTALEPAHLFRISQQALFELMSEQAAIMKGIIRVLCRRLRAKS